MADTNIPSSTVSGNSPVVFQRDGAVFTNSRDVAVFFEKRPADVNRAIEALISEMPDGGVRNFAQTPYVDPQNGQTYKSYDLTKDGFSLLAMGFTGPKALGFKLRYIEQFNAMETALKTMPEPVAIDLSNPDQLLQLLTSYAIDKKALMAKVEADKPKVDGFDRLCDAEGSITITEAAKSLQLPRVKDLTQWLVANSWCYRRAGNKNMLAHQDKIRAGLLVHKMTVITIAGSDEEKISEQVRITAAGLTKLARVFNQALIAKPKKGNGTAATLDQGAAA